MPYQILEPWQMKQVQRLHQQEVPVTDLAERYNVHRRTIYRCLAVKVERVYLAGWGAWFALSPKKAPQRLTPWEAA